MLTVTTILHATDFSPQSDHAFHLACSLARDYWASLILVHVWDTRPAVYGEFRAFPVDLDQDRQALQAKLDQMKHCNETEVSEAFLIDGDPATEIVNLAKREHCDLIVMGTHGRTGLGRVLMGSVAEQVVRKAHCPVLTIKSPAGMVAEAKAEETPAPIG